MVSSTDVLDFLSPNFWTDASSKALFNPRLLDLRELEEFWLAVRNEHQLDGKIVLQSSGTSSLGPGASSLARSHRLIVLSKSAFLLAANSVNKKYSIEQADTWLLTLPLFHVGGLSISARACLSRSKVEVLSKWDVDEFQKELLTKNIQWTSLVPTQVFDLVQKKVRSAKSLKGVFVGGGRLSPELWKKARDLNWPLILSYGMTETAAMIAASDIGQTEMRPLAHAQIIKDSQNFLKIKSQSLFDSYILGNSKEYHFLKPQRDADDFWLSSDQGDVSEKNEITIFGRAGQVFKVSGELVRLDLLRAKWEKVVDPFLWSQSCLLIGVPDSRLENKIILCYESKLTEAHSLKSSSFHSLGSHDIHPLSEIEKCVQIYNAQVLPFERIHLVHTVNEFPRTELGKIQENLLVQNLIKELE